MEQGFNKNKFYSPVLLFFVIIGLIASLYLVYERNHVEQVQNGIENIVDYDAVLRASSYEKRSSDEAFNELKAAGVTAMAIYDRTLEKASDAGQVVILNANDAKELGVIGASPSNGATYILQVPGKEGYFREIREDLEHRLGINKVHLVNTMQGPAIEIKDIPAESLKTMKLSISRLQAKEVINRDFNVIVRPSNFKNETKDDVALVFRRIDGLPRIHGMVFVGKEVLGYPNDIDTTLQYLNQKHIPVAGIEAINQLQYDPQQGFDQMANANRYSVGRLYTVSKDEMKKLSPAEVSQWFYISDIERNIRFNLFPIYEEGIGNKTALETSIGYIKDVNDKLSERGFQFGEPSVYPPYYPNALLVVLAMSGAISLSVMVLNMLCSMKHHKQLVLYFTLLLISVVLYVVTHGTLITQLWALASAIAAPVAGMVFLMDHWKGYGSKKKVGALKASLLAVAYLVGATLIAFIGGMYIASMLGNTRFFMEFALFRGVKLTFVLPILLTAIAFLQRFPLWKGKVIHSTEDAKTFVKDFLTIDIKLYVLFIAGFLAAVAIIFVGRSGHTAGVPVPGFEIALRRFLENTLYARPREKEFLIGHPALVLASFAVLRKWPTLIHFVLTVAGVIGIGSMVETFCHIRTPVLMSIMRGIDGLWIGILIGLVAIIAVRLVMYIITWYQAKGASHE